MQIERRKLLSGLGIAGAALAAESLLSKPLLGQAHGIGRGVTGAVYGEHGGEHSCCPGRDYGASVKEARFAGGAKGDGATLDDSAFLAAEAEADFIYVPVGTYRLSTPMILNGAKWYYGPGDGHLLQVLGGKRPLPSKYDADEPAQLDDDSRHKA
ncbi:hypothetical protein PV433_33690 [Paenibacillus sp. GYB004]|uniref:hypothetical protein n=1 Tax=Paenibacillus sp. GYB004 TaxID=2994393 RepID=UPI002F96DF53